MKHPLNRLRRFLLLFTADTFSFCGSHALSQHAVRVFLKMLQSRRMMGNMGYTRVFLLFFSNHLTGAIR